MSAEKAPQRGQKRRRESTKEDDRSLVVKDLITIGSTYHYRATTKQDIRPTKAEYDSRSKNHFQLLSIQGKMDFTLRQMTVPVGTLAGSQVLILEPVLNKPFRFMALPAEIRNLVHGHIVPKKTGNIAFKGQQQPKPEFGVTGISNKTHGRDTHFTASINRGSHLDLLVVSKKFLNEVAPIVYERRLFMFHATATLQSFVPTLGNMVKFVRHVKLGCCANLRGQHFAQLAKATELRTLELDACIIYRWALQEDYTDKDDVEVWMDAFAIFLWEAFLHCLYRCLRSQSGESVLDVVQVCNAKYQGHHGCVRNHYMFTARCANVAAQLETSRLHQDDLADRLRSALANEFNIVDGTMATKKAKK